MTTNDSSTTPRYSVWHYASLAESHGPYHATWEQAQEEHGYQQGSEPRFDWRIWDHSTTPPSDVTDHNPEGTHAMTYDWKANAEAQEIINALAKGREQATPHPGKRPTTPTIPEAVHKLTISRGTRENSPMYVTLEGTAWHMSITTTDAEVLTRIHEIAAAMEAVK